ncbi:uncharacterized protein CLUP02_04376 [Colletotrichum lupini]|uniref:Uncharacterized protein n=1 Tax=Colletotrichum lupini TaxID=145971 RepID=A0A9Q8SK68_9PEZI|nr:uncharacterized protein CLUP02_04376 [Colletotrichum lupini]UQC78897.1 hypothetical protein CLUP02_04376 [Colletotrichum lupini]
MVQWILRRSHQNLFGGPTLIPEVRCSNPGPGGPFFTVFSRYIIGIFGPTLRF